MRIVDKDRERGRIIRQCREEAGKLQKDIAHLLNITVATYSKKENGDIGLTLDEAKTLAEYYKTTIDRLLFT